MWRKAAGVVLALAMGFVLYRGVLVATPGEQYPGSSASLRCPDGNVPRPLFDLLTGFPDGWVVTCRNSDGLAAVQSFPMDPMWDHWGRSVLFGLAGSALALVALWWGARRRPIASQRRSEAQSSA